MGAETRILSTSNQFNLVSVYKLPSKVQSNNFREVWGKFIISPHMLLYLPIKKNAYIKVPIEKNSFIKRRQTFDT